MSDFPGLKTANPLTDFSNRPYRKAGTKEKKAGLHP